MSLRPTPTAPAAPRRLDTVLSVGYAHTMQHGPAPVGMLAELFPSEVAPSEVAPEPNPVFTMRLNVECTENGAYSLVIDQLMVNRASIGTPEPTISIRPDALVLQHDHSLESKDALTRELKFLSGRVSEGDKSYELRVIQTGRLRDGGTTFFKLEMKHPTKDRYYPVKLTLGGNVTTFELTYQ